jgi:Na+-transporting NADH:ubiquinone oxidoreductase subunit A
MSMTSIKIKKGYQLKIAGHPNPRTASLPKPSHVAALPEKIPFIKPRLLKKVGDRVNIGSPLFEDKRNQHLRFLSPGGGEITDIRFGPRRVIKEIVIKLSDNEAYEAFDSLSGNDLEKVDRQTLINDLLTGGVWPLIKELPFRNIAHPETVPPAIYVSLGNKEPFHPRPEVYLKGHRDLFEFGIRILRKISGDHVYVAADHRQSVLLSELDGLVTHTYSGNFPADDPGVLLYHTKTSSRENRSWFVSGQDVLLLAQFLKYGRYPIDRTVVLAGTGVKEALHLNTRIGVPLAHISRERSAGNGVRHVVGGIFRGYSASIDSYMGFYETSLTLVPEGKEREFLAFVQPGFHKPSYSRTFLSVFNKTDLTMNCNFHGGERACIGCGYCSEVCPVDILPQLTYKSVLGEEIEETLSHGLLDCVECGLCSYVCPSKIELVETLKQAKAAYYIEQT